MDFVWLAGLTVTDTNVVNDADLDGDSITTCAGDCNEDLTVVDGFGTIGENTYPGAGYNEADPCVQLIWTGTDIRDRFV